MGLETDPVTSAVREAKEEFNLTIQRSRLIAIPEKGTPLQNFLKVWKQGQRVYAQLDPGAKSILVPTGALTDTARDRDALAYIRSLPPSSLGEDTPLALVLDTFNREFCFYFLCVLSQDEVEVIAFSDGEAEGAQKVPLSDFIRDAEFMTDSSFTLVRGIPDLEERVRRLLTK